MDKIYNFFISSTSKDLIEERKAVIDCVLKTHNIPVAMELFTANSFSQWEYIKKEIDNIDYYILILGGKYGTIVQNEQISYTEKEFEYAKQKGIPIMPFVVKDMSKLTVDKSEVQENRRQLLENFRQKVTSGLLANFYTDIEDLKLKVSLAIPDVIKEKPRPGWVRGKSQEHLINNIQKATKDDTAFLFEGDVSKNENSDYFFQNIPRKNNKSSPAEILEKLSDRAKQILCDVSEDPQGVIIIQKTLAGNNIQTNNKSMMPNGTHREYIEVSDTIQDLVKSGLLTENGENGEVFQLNKQGYELTDLLLKNQRVIKPKQFDYASLPNIELADLDELAAIIGDTSKGLSTKQIVRLFDACDLKDVSPTSGKNNRLYDAFKMKQRSSNSSCSIWKFIEKTLDPIRTNDSADTYEFLYKRINQVLGKYNVCIDNEGKFVSSNG